MKERDTFSLRLIFLISTPFLKEAYKKKALVVLESPRYIYVLHALSPEMCGNDIIINETFITLRLSD